MAKYRSRKFAEFLYGGDSVIALSVAPMSVLVQTFTEVLVTWRTPTGDFTRIRLVRNQGGFPETFEDGAVVWEEFATQGSVSRDSIVDGKDNPETTTVVPGRMVYYRMFLYTDSKVWVNAGSASALVPLDHQYQEKLFGVLPRVFTSIEQTPLGELDTRIQVISPGDTDLEDKGIYDLTTFNNANAALNVGQTRARGQYVNDLYNFLGGLGFTLDELVTYLELINPSHTSFDTPASLLPIEFSHVGLTPEPGLPVKNQKRLLREANYLYTRRGTELALGTYVESLTGYAPVISVSSNLLLDALDSTFYQSVGNWTATNATLEPSTEQLPTNLTGTIDTDYTCKITSTSAGTMTLGEDNPITKGVPIKPSTQYTIFGYVKSPVSTGTFTITAKFYNKDGVFVAQAISSAVTVDNTWKVISLNPSSTASSSYMTLTVSYSDAGTYYVDQFCVNEGTSSSYSEARAVDVLLFPTAKNLVTNPSFESTPVDAEWTKTNATVTAGTTVPADINSGASSAQIVRATGSGTWYFEHSNMSLNRGKYYTASFYIKTTAAIKATFASFDGLGVLLSSSEVNVPITADWTKFTTTLLVPAEPNESALNLLVEDYLSIKFEGTTGTTNIDCVLVEEALFASEYYDGSFPSEYGVVWEGVPFESQSHKYVGFNEKLPRLVYTLSDWLPQNCWWRVLSSQGVEFTNLNV